MTMENKTVTGKAEGNMAAVAARPDTEKRIEITCRVPGRFAVVHRLFVERVTERVAREIAEEAADMMTALGAAMREAAEAARPDMAGGDAPAPREDGRADREDAGDREDGRADREDAGDREDGHADREERGDGE